MNKSKNTKQENSPALVPSASAVPQETRPAAEVEQSDRAELIATVEESLCTITGVKSGKLALRLVSRVAMQLSGSDHFERLSAAMEMIAELKPENATQTMLATQMLGVHEAAVQFLSNATAEGQTAEGRDANTHRTVRLMRLFIEQLEAMAKLKGKTGQQKVVVEHVHVNAGGQAIVGAVTTRRGPRDGGNNDK